MPLYWTQPVVRAVCCPLPMISCAVKNPYVDVRLFGQEINPESYAICLADMLIKGQDVKNIMGDEEANTLKTDCFRIRRCGW